MKKQIFIATRAIYGSEKTPVELREYRLTFNGPVGTKTEWTKWANENNAIVKFKELTKTQKHSIKKLNKSWWT